MRYPHLSGPGTGQAWPPLVAAAHGSTDPRAAAMVTELADLVRARAARIGLRGLQVRAAYLGHALPSVPDALEALHGDGRGRAAVVLPLLLTEAYHSDTDLPAVLREASRRLPGLRLHYGRPLGPHPGLLRALECRLAETGVRAAARAGAAGTGSAGADAAGTGAVGTDPAGADAAGTGAVGTDPAGADAANSDGGDTAVVLAAAGSSRPTANAAVARLAGAWRSARGWRDVVPAYASAASPTPAEAVDALRRSGAPRVAVATYLLAPGVFADRVREQSLAAGADAVSGVLGAAPEVADVIINRYLQAAVAGCPSADPARALGPLVS
jgi:sirohydrochlorin ferrochelatase